MTVWRAEDINKRTRDKVRPGDKIIKDGFSYDVIGNHNGLITLKDTDKKRVNYENKRLEEMSKQWDVRELEWFGVEHVQIGDTIKNEDGTISKVVEKHNGSIWTDADKPVRICLYTIIRLIIKILFSPFWLIMFVLMWLVLIAFNTKDDDLTIKDMDILWNYWRINDR